MGEDEAFRGASPLWDVGESDLESDVGSDGRWVNEGEWRDVVGQDEIEEVDGEDWRMADGEVRDDAGDLSLLFPDGGDVDLDFGDMGEGGEDGLLPQEWNEEGLEEVEWEGEAVDDVDFDFGPMAVEGEASPAVDGVDMDLDVDLFA